MYLQHLHVGSKVILQQRVSHKTQHGSADIDQKIRPVMSDHDSVSYHYIVSVTDLESSVSRASQRVNTSGSENSCDNIRLNHLNIPLNFSKVGLPMQLYYSLYLCWTSVLLVLPLLLVLPFQSWYLCVSQLCGYVFTIF